MVVCTGQQFALSALTTHLAVIAAKYLTTVLFRSNFTPSNPFAHLGKIQRPTCDIYMENVYFDLFNR